VRLWPAIEVRGSVEADLVLALVDDFSPTALEERGDAVRVFFPTRERRDAALHDLRNGALSGALQVRALDVDDEDWARRSQENLRPVTIGRLTIYPEPSALSPEPSSIVIQPSMGFGTGHHATTRLCLAALQSVPLAGATVLDVGTGSGVLAIAAARLGAARALGIDTDPDAVAAARENLALNPDARNVAIESGDLADLATERAADLVTANLTGALLVREAAALAAAVRPGGFLILSGLLATERGPVVGSFGRLSLIGEWSEDEWVCLLLRRP